MTECRKICGKFGKEHRLPAIILDTLQFQRNPVEQFGGKKRLCGTLRQYGPHRSYLALRATDVRFHLKRSAGEVLLGHGPAAGDEVPRAGRAQGQRRERLRGHRGAVRGQCKYTECVV